MIRTNYHTHTLRCKHANGTDEEYVLAAIAAGYQEIGFADHTPWPYKNGFHPYMRMEMRELSDYLCSIRNLKQKYAHQISIKIGLECEYFEEYLPWLAELVETNQVDYLIFGNHFYENDETGLYFGRGTVDERTLKLYVDEAIKGMKTGLFAYLCHPDLFMRSYLRWDEIAQRESLRLCQAAKELGIPLEYNLQGQIYNRIFRADSYPYPKFWELAVQVGNKVIIGVDAHKHDEFADTKAYEQARAYLQSLGANLIYTLDEAFER